MKVVVNTRAEEMRPRLDARLETIARLRCLDHGDDVAAVTVNVWENGWFSCLWITCCERLAHEAESIAGVRC